VQGKLVLQFKIPVKAEKHFIIGEKKMVKQIMLVAFKMREPDHIPLISEKGPGSGFPAGYKSIVKDIHPDLPIIVPHVCSLVSGLFKDDLLARDEIVSIFQQII